MFSSIVMIDLLSRSMLQLIVFGVLGSSGIYVHKLVYMVTPNFILLTPAWLHRSATSIHSYSLNLVQVGVTGPMALIDRNFQGFGKELFTDAGKYVIHFGDQPMEAATQATKTIQAAHPDKPAPPVTAVAKYRNPDMQVIATSTAEQLVCLSLCS